MLLLCLVTVLFAAGAAYTESNAVTVESTNATTVEAEDMAMRYWPSVAAADRADASGGEAVRINDQGKVVATSRTKQVSKVGVRMAAQFDCSGSMRVQVRVDGTRYIDEKLDGLDQLRWYSADADIPAGRHKVAVVLLSGPGCSGKLWVDRVDLVYEPPTLVALGVWPGGDDSGNHPWSTGEVDSYAQEAGRGPDFVTWFQSWGPYSKGVFPRADAEEGYQRGYAQVITWQPQDYTAPADDPNYSLDAILSGRHDDYIRQYARDLAAWGRPVYLRPFHEMNGDWYPYGAGKNGNTPEKLVSAWRKVHQIFAEEGATNVGWVWSPNAGVPTYTPEHPMAAYYPGDDYVDWIALDGYNWADARDMRWYSFDEVFSQSYKEITAITQKPLMIAETASHTSSGDKAAWIDAMRWDVPHRYTRVQAVAWFNQDTEGALWRFDTSQASKEAYRAMAADPLWQGRLP